MPVNPTRLDASSPDRQGSAETVAVTGGPGRDRTSDRATMSDRTPIPGRVGLWRPVL